MYTYISLSIYIYIYTYIHIYIYIYIHMFASSRTTPQGAAVVPALFTPCNYVQ